MTLSSPLKLLTLHVGNLGAKNGSGFYKWDDATFKKKKERRDDELLRRLKDGL